MPCIMQNIIGGLKDGKDMRIDKSIKIELEMKWGGGVLGNS